MEKNKADEMISDFQEPQRRFEDRKSFSLIESFMILKTLKKMFTQMLSQLFLFL